jgi:hypothetical protein
MIIQNSFTPKLSYRKDMWKSGEKDPLVFNFGTTEGEREQIMVAVVDNCGNYDYGDDDDDDDDDENKIISSVIQVFYSLHHCLKILDEDHSY